MAVAAGLSTLRSDWQRWCVYLLPMRREDAEGVNVSERDWSSPSSTAQTNLAIHQPVDLFEMDGGQALKIFIRHEGPYMKLLGYFVGCRSSAEGEVQ